jgi:tRNA(fMet)-specific endonuclease VapC
MERFGEPIPLANLQAASIAVANDLVLITGNVKHFEHITGLKVESWLWSASQLLP